MADGVENEVLLSDEILEAKAKQECLATIKEWSELTADDLKVRASHGITNKVFIVTNEKTSPKGVIFRVLNTFLEKMIHRDDEKNLFLALGESGLGPKCLLMKGFYRFEEFYDAEMVQPEQLVQTKVLKQVADELYKFHQFQFDFQDKTMYIEKVFKKWSKLAVDKCYARYDQFNEREREHLDYLRKMIDPEFINEALTVLPHNGRIASCCHNDLLNGNMLILRETGEMKFIDFEYSCPSYVVGDIANFMAEAMFDYSHNEFPYYKMDPSRLFSTEKQREFLELYFANETFESEEAKNREIEEALKQIPLFVAMGHYVWAVWGLLMANPNSGEDFSYTDFSYERFRQFEHFMSEQTSWAITYQGDF